jgi:exopolysaccharide production protein ExoZ
VPGWSINYEMFFYALFAISLLRGSFRYRFLALLLVSLVALGPVGWKSAPAIFYTSSVLLEFLLGVVVYFVVVRYRPAISRPVLALVTAAAVLLLAIENGDAVRGYADGPCAALIVWSVVEWSRDLKSEWLHKIGNASYSIYLFHLASFWIPNTLLHQAGLEMATPFSIVFVILLHVACSVAIGLLIHRAIEQPLLEFLRRRLATSRYGQRRSLALP